MKIPSLTQMKISYRKYVIGLFSLSVLLLSSCSLMVGFFGVPAPTERESFQGEVTKFHLVDSDQSGHEAYGMELADGGRIVFIDGSNRITRPRGIEKKVGQAYRLDGIHHLFGSFRVYSEDGSRLIGFPGWERIAAALGPDSEFYFESVEPRRFRPLP